ncbi:hypothetical protein DSO57_1012616 [Entomophthora muscae]|uniref:Uncharacterized protein n=1 Tax=Entomophthora muscae TaxID=34485 RepID=A0ACC2RKR1_9FUNG|nr:hypothetical protein DSO57_1012616 [Entomophthora muscae]
MCDDLDLNVDNYILPFTEGERTLVPSLPSLDKSASVPPEALEIPPPVASWVITGLALMELNSYFPQMSPVSSFWSPLRAFIPVLHWAASWWFLSPGWEPNLVSLPPSLTQKTFKRPCNFPVSHLLIVFFSQRFCLQNGFLQKLKPLTLTFPIIT